MLDSIGSRNGDIRGLQEILDGRILGLHPLIANPACLENGQWLGSLAP